jgi:hypothetical protein
MSSEPIKYPEQPQYRATVTQNEALIASEEEPKQHQCAKCLMGALSLIFVLLGLTMTSLAAYTIIVLNYGGENLLSSWSAATVYALLVVGLALLAISVIVWVSSCHPTAVCSKIVLVIFSIVMLAVFLLQVCLLIMGCIWLGVIDVNVTVGNVTVAGGSIDRLFNESVQEVQTLCCTPSNTSFADICSHIITADDKAADCGNFAAFYALVVGFLSPLIKAVAIFLGVVAFCNLVAFFCSCCLVSARKRAAYWKPKTTTYAQ